VKKTTTEKYFVTEQPSSLSVTAFSQVPRQLGLHMKNGPA